MTPANRTEAAGAAGGAVLCLLTLLALPAFALAPNCAAAVEGFNQQARGERGLAPAVVAFERVRASCLAGEDAGPGRALALLHLRQAQAERQPARQLALVQAGLRYGRPWQALAALGDLLQSHGDPSPDFAGASLAYQEALNDIANTTLVPRPPPAAEIERLLRLAQQTRMLAERPVPLPGTRDGSPSALARRELRGVSIERIAQPIHFETNTERMTPLGREAAQQLLETLRAANMPPIRLIGHADPRGTREHNMALSRRRVVAIRQILVEAGYDADRVAIEARGAEDPLRIEEPERYTREQSLQMNRRVELVW